MQILAPEIDPVFTPELMDLKCDRVALYDFQNFPALEHGFAVRNDKENEAELKGSRTGKECCCLLVQPIPPLMTTGWELEGPRSIQFASKFYLFSVQVSRTSSSIR